MNRSPERVNGQHGSSASTVSSAIVGHARVCYKSFCHPGSIPPSRIDPGQHRGTDHAEVQQALTRPFSDSSKETMEGHPSREIFRFGAFELEITGRRLQRDGLKIRLEEKSFRLLAILVRRAGETVTRDE